MGCRTRKLLLLVLTGLLLQNCVAKAESKRAKSPPDELLLIRTNVLVDF